MEIFIQESSFHRNGVCGIGFYAIRFQWTPDDSDKPENFLATLFDESGACAVISLDRIEKCGIAFAQGNSWRGDHFEEELRRQVGMDASVSPAAKTVVELMAPLCRLYREGTVKPEAILVTAEQFDALCDLMKIMTRVN